MNDRELATWFWDVVLEPTTPKEERVSAQQREDFIVKVCASPRALAQIRELIAMQPDDLVSVEGTKTAFVDFTPDSYPFTITAYPAGSTRDVDPVWHIDVTGPGAVTIPSRADTGQQVRVVVRYPSGRVDRITA